MIDGKVRADIEGGKSSEERERRHDGVWRSGVKENRVWKDWRETLEWRSAENHPRIIQHIKRLALKFWSQHFYSLDLQLYCWVAEDSSALCAYSALFCCCLSSCISDGCRCYACSLKRWKLSKCLGAAVRHKYTSTSKIRHWHTQCENLLPLDSACSFEMAVWQEVTRSEPKSIEVLINCRYQRVYLHQQAHETLSW